MPPSSAASANARRLQTADSGRLRHLITLDGVSKAIIKDLFLLADQCESNRLARPLAGKLFVNIFFESSTRTRTAFEAAAKQLGADVVNLDQITMAGERKRESLQDTVRTVGAMGAAGVALRHSQAGAAEEAARAADEFNIALINGGTGCESHPTQGLADAYTLRETHGEDFSNVSAAIVGDVLHSRVARSDAHIFRTLGMRDLRLVGPPSLCPPSLSEELGAPVFANMDEGIAGADAVIMLRVQRERLEGGGGLSDASYFADYGLDARRLETMKPSAAVMHPGPLNRGMEIADIAADGPRSKILRQVQNGMKIRKAALTYLCG